MKVFLAIVLALGLASCGALHAQVGIGGYNYGPSWDYRSWNRPHGWDRPYYWGRDRWHHHGWGRYGHRGGRHQ
jgi:hypothetical protein